MRGQINPGGAVGRLLLALYAKSQRHLLDVEPYWTAAAEEMLVVRRLASRRSKLHLTEGGRRVAFGMLKDEAAQVVYDEICAAQRA